MYIDSPGILMEVLKLVFSVFGSSQDALRGKTIVEISKFICSFIGLKDALNLLKYEAKSPIPEKNL